jgi:hippurate hydrolase
VGEYGIDEFYALHVSPEYAPGGDRRPARPGTLFAGSASVTVEFTGAPGHAAMPHRAVDPIVSEDAPVTTASEDFARIPG